MFDKGISQLDLLSDEVYSTYSVKIHSSLDITKKIVVVL
jgi:hypothetical protein